VGSETLLFEWVPKALYLEVKKTGNKTDYSLAITIKSDKETREVVGVKVCQFLPSPHTVDSSPPSLPIRNQQQRGRAPVDRTKAEQRGSLCSFFP
jgi:hypothetical protein